MPVEPEFSIQVAYTAGRNAALQATLGANPYPPGILQTTWARGYDDARKDLNPLVLDSRIPPILSTAFVLSEVQLRSLFTSPVPVLPAVNGIAHRAVFLHLYREAGTPYVPGAGNLRLRAGSLNQAVIAPVDAGLAGAVPEVSIPILTDNVRLSAILNQPITFSQGAANMTGGSGRILGTLFYRDWSISPL